MDTLLVTPMAKERDRLAEALDMPHTVEPVGRLSCLFFPDLRLRLAVSGHGKAQTAVQVRHLLDRGPPVGVVICSGAAGSLTEGVGVGDLVAATETVEHDYTERFAIEPLPRFPGHPGVLAELGRLRIDGVRLHLGPVASGDEDVVCSDRAGEIASRTGALAVAWEGSGAARACRLCLTPFIELRAVTDQADKAAPVDFEVNLALAMRNLARLLRAWRLSEPS